MRLQTLLVFFMAISLTPIGAQNLSKNPTSNHPLPFQAAMVKRLSKNINTAGADLGAVRYGDKIYFSTPGTADDKSAASKIYTVSGNRTARLDPMLNHGRKSQHVGNVALMPDASRMYFTVCDDANEDNCKIWVRDREYDGGWGAARRLGAPINVRNSTSTQPAIGWDASRNSFMLYFVSDRAGGKGKKDIWQCEITRDGKFGEPESLAINSAQDDITPFFHRATNTLYYSSDGLGGIGGFDIFYSRKDGQRLWTEPRNVGRDLNSRYNDLCFFIHDGSSTGYLSSDRPGSTCYNNLGWNCCDIYEVKFTVPTSPPKTSSDVSAAGNR